MRNSWKKKSWFNYLMNGMQTQSKVSISSSQSSFEKDQTFCNTIENKVRIYLALGLQSVGYRRFYQRLFKQTGIQEGQLMNLYVREEDRMHARK
jgi:hypothetical protein